MDEINPIRNIGTEKISPKIGSKIIEGKLPQPQMPIGVFDSGVGGLTVYTEMVKRLPHEDIIYIADTARVPFGGRPDQEIIKINSEILNYFAAAGVKMVVMACGTSSSIAYPVLKDKYKMPIISLIEPGSRAAVEATKKGMIGVIATQGTVRSGAYQNNIRDINREIKVFSEPCPLFVPLIEGGFIEAEETKKVAKEYLNPLISAGVDTLILGCTHYPHIAKIISEIMGPEVVLIDPAQQAVVYVEEVLKKENLLSENKAAKHQFLATGSVAQFTEIGSRLLGKPLVGAKQIKLV